MKKNIEPLDVEPIKLFLNDANEEALEYLEAKLSKLEKKMNGDSCLCCPEDTSRKHYAMLTKMDTKIIVCPTCQKRIVERGTYRIHKLEIHCPSMAQEVDGPQNETMVKLALKLK